MKIRSAALDQMAGECPSLLAFDCEFWHKGEVFLPREIGGYHLLRAGDSWNVTEPFFAVLPPPPGQLNRVSSKFSTTTPETAESLDILEATSKFAPELLGDNDMVREYFFDSEIIPHIKHFSWLKNFIKIMSQSVVVIKGDMDLKALKSACRTQGFTYHAPLGIVDIATHNPQFTKRCGAAKLEETYDCIKKELSPALKKAFPVGKAHDPISDAAMTIQIAAWIATKDVK
jgi:hypothetical protein